MQAYWKSSYASSPDAKRYRDFTISGYSPLTRVPTSSSPLLAGLPATALAGAFDSHFTDLVHPLT
jgi:hypothetical protein